MNVLLNEHARYIKEAFELAKRIFEQNEFSEAKSLFLLHAVLNGCREVLNRYSNEFGVENRKTVEARWQLGIAAWELGQSKKKTGEMEEGKKLVAEANKLFLEFLARYRKHREMATQEAWQESYKQKRLFWLEYRA